MAEDTWTIQAALDWTRGYLERKGDQTPLLSAQWLLSEATGLSRIELYVNFDRPLTLQERDVLRGYVTRRGRGEPLQYITGEVGFRHVSVKVRPGVLIPRPETEVLVSEVLAALPQPERPRAAEYRDLVDESLSANDADQAAADAESGVEGDASSPSTELLVADLCTGSGCIACSLAYEHPQVRVMATDIAQEAVSLAAENARLLGLEDRVEVLEGDLGNCIPDRYLGCFDAVATNPPYVPTEALSSIPREVADFEPALALDGGEDGLDLFRRIIPWSFKALKEGGFFACELHETCLDDAAQIAREHGFVNVRIVYDLTNRPRILTAAKPIADAHAI